MSNTKWKLKVNRHGGYCCGMYHVFYFRNQTYEQWKKWDGGLSEILRKSSAKSGDANELETIKFYKPDWGTYDHPDYDGNFAIECILTDYQLETYDKALARYLKELGFVHTHRWENPNSGRFCNQFVYSEPTEHKPAWKKEFDK